LITRLYPPKKIKGGYDFDVTGTDGFIEKFGSAFLAPFFVV
jgi:hypothetical protein